MKKIIVVLILCVAFVATLLSCNKENEPKHPIEKYSLELTLPTDSTRWHNSNWSASKNDFIDNLPEKITFENFRVVSKNDKGIKGKCEYEKLDAEFVFLFKKEAHYIGYTDNGQQVYEDVYDENSGNIEINVNNTNTIFDIYFETSISFTNGFAFVSNFSSPVRVGKYYTYLNPNEVVLYSNNKK